MQQLLSVHLSISVPGTVVKFLEAFKGCRSSKEKGLQPEHKGPEGITCKKCINTWV